MDGSIVDGLLSQEPLTNRNQEQRKGDNDHDNSQPVNTARPRSTYPQFSVVNETSKHGKKERRQTINVGCLSARAPRLRRSQSLRHDAVTLCPGTSGEPQLSVSQPQFKYKIRHPRTVDLSDAGTGRGNLFQDGTMYRPAGTSLGQELSLVVGTNFKNNKYNMTGYFANRSSSTGPDAETAETTDANKRTASPSPVRRARNSSMPAVCPVAAGATEDYTNQTDNKGPTARGRQPRSRERRTKQRASQGKDAMADQGVSNTSILLLESKVSKNVFSFPEISGDEQRRALGTTPRYASLSARTASRSPTRRGRSLGARQESRNSSCERLPSLERSCETTSPVSQHLSSPQTSRRSSGDCGDVRSGDSLTSRCAGGRDKYARMVALGLPKVNIDIDRNHFSKRGKKSARLQSHREGADPSEDAVTVSRSCSVTTATTVTSNTPDHTEARGQGPEQKQTTKLNGLVTSELSLDITNTGTCLSPRSLIKSGSTGALSAMSSDATTRPNYEKVLSPRSMARRPGCKGTSDCGKETIGISYFRMLPPGLDCVSTDSTVVHSPVISKHRTVYHSCDNQTFV